MEEQSIKHLAFDVTTIFFGILHVLNVLYRSVPDGRVDKQIDKTRALWRGDEPIKRFLTEDVFSAFISFSTISDEQLNWLQAKITTQPV